MRISIGLANGSRLPEAIDVLSITHNLDFPGDGRGRACLRVHAGCYAGERGGKTEPQRTAPMGEQGKGLLQ